MKICGVCVCVCVRVCVCVCVSGIEPRYRLMQRVTFFQKNFYLIYICFLYSHSLSMPLSLSFLLSLTPSPRHSVHPLSFTMNHQTELQTNVRASYRYDRVFQRQWWVLCEGHFLSVCVSMCVCVCVCVCVYGVCMHGSWSFCVGLHKLLS